MGYGRKIIDYISKKRSDCSAIRYELEQKIQADSDRSDIRVLEAGLSSQQYGNNRQSTRNAENEECNRLIRIAKENGLFIDKSEWYKFGDKRSVATWENIVYLNKDVNFNDMARIVCHI